MRKFIHPSRHTAGKKNKDPVARRPGRQKEFPPVRENLVEADSLFEQFAWLYVFCREYLFRDDTARMARFLWKGCGPPAGSRLLDLGCGPGFYARRLAERFGELRVTGIDRSGRQLTHARRRTEARNLENCDFQRGDVHDLAFPDGSVDSVVCSRLFTVVPGREKALGEMYRVLAPGGRCFIAEPRSVTRAALPLRALWLLSYLYSLTPARLPATPGYREPRRPAVMTGAEFDALLATRPWSTTCRWQDLWYQYAVCEKGSSAGPDTASFRKDA